MTAACGSNWTANLLHYLRALPLAKNCVLKNSRAQQVATLVENSISEQGRCKLNFPLHCEQFPAIKKCSLQANTAGLLYFRL